MNGRRSPAVAALLSLLLPGLGQAYAGRPRRALVLLMPALFVWAVVVAVLAAGRDVVFGYLVQPAVLSALLIVIAGLFVGHATAVIDAWLVARRRVARPPAGVVAVGGLVLALAATVVLYGLPGSYVYALAVHLPRFTNTGPSSGIPTPSWLLSPSPTALAIQPTRPPTARPTPTARPPATATPPPTAAPTPLGGRDWAADGRLDVLLLGSDAGPARWSARPDAVLLVSVDIETGRAALFGFPRYTNNIPVPPETAEMFKDGRFPGYLNALYVAALNNPRRFPYNDEAGWGVMAGVVQELAGVEIDGYLVTNLAGFQQMIDELGGLWVDVPPPGVVDSRYGLGTGRRVSLRLDAGCQELDGRRALFFSRSRHQDGDIPRLHRQLITLQSLRRSYDPLAVLPRLSDIFAAAGDNFYTSFAAQDLPVLAEIAARVDPDRAHKLVFTAPDYPRSLPGDTVERIHAKVGGIFDEPEPPPEEVDCPPGD